MRVLVTGANGHIGCNLVRELLTRGHEVVAMVRAGSDARGLDGLDVEIRPGDVLDKASVEAAARGCEAIEHLAAVYATRGDAEAIMRPAVIGTTHVFEVAAALGIRRVVMTSSTTAVGANFSVDAPPRDETRWNDEFTLPYYRAKTESERLAWQLAEQLGLELVTVLPSGVLGEHDWRVTPSTKYVLDLATGRAMTGRGGFSYVEVHDVAFVHAAALERGRPGERYLVTGANLGLRQIGEIVSAATGTKITHIDAPRWLTLATVTVQAAFARAIGRAPAITPDEARAAAGRWSFFDSSKAQREFGFTPRPAPEIIGAALRWLATQGLLPPAVRERVMASA